jgi:hypothetical protein
MRLRLLLLLRVKMCCRRRAGRPPHRPPTAAPLSARSRCMQRHWLVVVAAAVGCGRSAVFFLASILRGLPAAVRRGGGSRGHRRGWLCGGRRRTTSHRCGIARRRRGRTQTSGSTRVENISRCLAHRLCVSRRELGPRRCGPLSRVTSRGASGTDGRRMRRGARGRRSRGAACADLRGEALSVTQRGGSRRRRSRDKGRGNRGNWHRHWWVRDRLWRWRLLCLWLLSLSCLRCHDRYGQWRIWLQKHGMWRHHAIRGSSSSSSVRLILIKKMLLLQL